MPKPQTIYRAKMETPRFTFEAFADTGDAAIRLLRRAILKHVRVTGADRAYMLDGFEDDVRAEPIRLGYAYRDGMAFIVMGAR